MTERSQPVQLPTDPSNLEPLARFGALVLNEFREAYADIDGGWLQETAVKCGLLEPIEVTETTRCEKGPEDEMWYCECEIGDSCYRRTAASRVMDHE